MEDEVLASFAEVAVDEENFLTSLRKGGGEVGGDEAFTFAGDGAGDVESLNLFVERSELEVGAEGADGFGDDGFREFFNQDF